MRNHSRSTLLASALLALSTGCASLQTDRPLEDAVQTTGAQIDYIDDRVDKRIDENIERLLEDKSVARLDDSDRTMGGTVERPRKERYGVEKPIRQISFLAAYRNFTDGDLWDRVDAETALGMEYAHEVNNGLGFEIGAMGSLGTEDGLSGNVDVTGAAAEIYGGARYFLKRDDRWRPYVGGGLSAILAGVDNDAGGQVADDQDFSLGLYLHGGLQYDISDAMFLALDLRTLFGTDLNLDTTNGDADYVQLGLAFGFNL